MPTAPTRQRHGFGEVTGFAGDERFFAAGGAKPAKYACTSIVFDFFGIFCGAFMVFTQCDKT